MDVEQLDRSVAFYQAIFDYHVVGAQRAGMLLETKQLRSTRFPHFELALRESFGKRIMGSQAGSITAITFPMTDLRGEIRRLLTLHIPACPPACPVRWVGATPNPDADPPLDHVRLIDPDAYVIELVQA
jgi:catechol 2,3-dioxygenase-like lactoylglutathione lyase family enzyme